MTKEAKANWWFLVPAVVITALCLLPFWFAEENHKYSLFGLAAMDIYLVIVLGALALRQTSSLEMPTKWVAVLIVALLVPSTVIGFADQYRKNDSIAFNVSETSITKPEKIDRLTSAYFSFVTLTTLGYGDVLPKNEWGRILVMWELATTTLLLLCILPLVVGRLADFSKDTTSGPAKNVAH